MSTKPLTASAMRRLKHHLACAAAYLDDGASASARCHVVAAQLIAMNKGVRIPKGPRFWQIAELHRRPN